MVRKNKTKQQFCNIVVHSILFNICIYCAPRAVSTTIVHLSSAAFFSFSFMNQNKNITAIAEELMYFSPLRPRTPQADLQVTDGWMIVWLWLLSISTADVGYTILFRHRLERDCWSLKCFNDIESWYFTSWQQQNAAVDKRIKMHLFTTNHCNIQHNLPQYTEVVFTVSLQRAGTGCSCSAKAWSSGYAAAALLQDRRTKLRQVTS